MREVQVPQIGVQALIEHIVEVPESAARQIELLDIAQLSTCANSRLEDLLRESSSEGLFGIQVLSLLNGHTVKHLQFPQVEYAVNPVVLIPSQVVARDVQNDQP